MSMYPTRLPAPPGKPWRTDSELAMVRDWFYPNHATLDPYTPPEGDTRQIAIDKVRVYSFKDCRMPHALVATAYLSEAVVLDQQMDRRQHVGNVAMMSIYGMALVKFVNGFVDRDVAKNIKAELAASGDETSNKEESEGGDDMEQENENEKLVVKSGGESSMYAYAVKIGMPESFVDLRHQIVHGEIPELWILKKNTERALEWLWQKWWKTHAGGDPARALRARERKKCEIERAREERERQRRKVNEDEHEENDSIEDDEN